MAVLDETNRARVCAQVMREAELGTLTGMTKADLRAAVDAVDSWIDTNASSYNSALPQPARGALTLQQKTLLLCWVAMRRAGLFRAEED
jgi:hypothetical protein